MDWTLELVMIPVTDIDRAKTFYEERAGFHVDVDHRAGEDFRVVQMTPPGSGCSIAIMKNIDMPPGTQHGLHLCVSDIEVARAELVARGVDAGEPFHFGAQGQQPGLDPERRTYGTFLSFKDPDGNTWMVQEVHREAPVA